MTEIFLNPPDLIAAPQFLLVKPPRPPWNQHAKYALRFINKKKRILYADSEGVRGLYRKKLGGRYKIGGV